MKGALGLDDRIVKKCPQDLKVAITLEQLMQVADVAHTVQSWENFIKWNTRLFIELYSAYISGRGKDPSKDWFKGQISFYDFYIIPLVTRLQQTDVFGDMGNIFKENAIANKERWLNQGEIISCRLATMVATQPETNWH